MKKINVGCVNPEGNNSPTHSRSGLSGPSGRGIPVQVEGGGGLSVKCVVQNSKNPALVTTKLARASVVFGRLFIFPVFRFISPKKL